MVVQPQLQALSFTADEHNRIIVTVHQNIRDLQSNLLLEQTVRQIFTIEDNLITRFEITAR